MTPGIAITVEDPDGTVTVKHADPVILVDQSLLDEYVEQGRPMTFGGPYYDPQTGVLVLDTAGEYRYRYTGPSLDPFSRECSIFERF